MASHERYKEYVYHHDDLSPTTTHEYSSVFGSSSSYSPPYFSSPFGSEIGSATTESEEDDDLISELNQLTRRMAEYTFQDEQEEFHKSFISHTLSKNSKPIKSSVNPSEKADSVSGLAMNQKSYSEIGSEQVLTDEQIKIINVYELKNQPKRKKQAVLGHGGKRVINKGSENVKESQNINMENSGGGKSWKKRMTMNPLSPSPSPAGSGMRAVFLGGSNTRNGSAGTGVFLPTGTYSSAEPKRKPGCSTVLIPARVLQTLQKHFNNAGARSQSNSNVDGSTTPPWKNDVLARINGLLLQQKEHAQFQTRPAVAETNHDQEEVMKLPQEWTY